MVTLEVHDLDQSITIFALISRLQKNDMKKSEIKTYLRDFTNMLSWAKKHIRTEDAFTQDVPTTSSLEGGGKLQVD